MAISLVVPVQDWFGTSFHFRGPRRASDCENDSIYKIQLIKEINWVFKWRKEEKERVLAMHLAAKHTACSHTALTGGHSSRRRPRNRHTGGQEFMSLLRILRKTAERDSIALKRVLLWSGLVPEAVLGKDLKLKSWCRTSDQTSSRNRYKKKFQNSHTLHHFPSRLLCSTWKSGSIM